MIVADSNVHSELMKADPTPVLRRWFRLQRGNDLYTTVITQAEMLYGTAILPAGHRKTELENALPHVFNTVYAGRVLAFDSAAAIQFVEIAAHHKRLGRDLKTPDAQIAAIARAYGAVLATRNVRDFEHCGIEVIDPWTA